MNAPRLTLASIIAAKISIIYVVVITIAAELSPVLKTILKNITGHHWITKSLSSLILYLLLLFLIYFLAKTPGDAKLNKYIMLLFWTSILGTLVLILFFAWHYFSI
jgi:hypothetical protein